MTCLGYGFCGFRFALALREDFMSLPLFISNSKHFSILLVHIKKRTINYEIWVNACSRAGIVLQFGMYRRKTETTHFFAVLLDIIVSNIMLLYSIFITEVYRARAQLGRT